MSIASCGHPLKVSSRETVFWWHLAKTNAACSEPMLWMSCPEGLGSMAAMRSIWLMVEVPEDGALADQESGTVASPGKMALPTSISASTVPTDHMSTPMV